MTKEQMIQILGVLNSWRNDPNLSEKVPDHYIHFTSFAGFKAMLEPYVEKRKPYVKLFPSQIQYLNDYQEYREGLKIVKNIETGIDSNIFAVCFCGEEDLLSQWKYYGKNSGIAMEFDFNNVNPCRLKWWGDISEKVSENSDELIMMPYPVFYDKHTKTFKQLLNKFKSSQPEDRLKNIFIPFCKNQSFHEENESRLIFYPINDEERKTDIKYRVTADKIVPQFECAISYYYAVPSERIPIKNIMIGPGNNQILLFNAVINMLERDKADLMFYDENVIKKRKPMLTGKVTHQPKSLYTVKKCGKLYVTYMTGSGITVQLSPTPFRP